MQDEQNTTSNIIYNLAHLGISIKDTEYFDIEVYARLIDLEVRTISNHESPRKANQKDIDLFLL